MALGSRPRVELASQDALNVFGVTAAHRRALGPGRWQVTLDVEAENATPKEQYHASWNYDHLSVARRSFDANCFTADPELLDPGAVGDGRLGFEVRCEPVGYIGLALSDGGVIDVTDSAESGRC